MYQGNTTVCRNLQGIWFLIWRKDGANFLVYDLFKETVIAIMILYNNSKAMDRSPDGDTNFFDIVVKVLQGDT